MCFVAFPLLLLSPLILLVNICCMTCSFSFCLIYLLSIYLFNGIIHFQSVFTHKQKFHRWRHVWWCCCYLWRICNLSSRVRTRKCSCSPHHDTSLRAGMDRCHTRQYCAHTDDLHAWRHQMVIMIKTEVRFKRCAPERTCETSDACARVAVNQVVASSSVLTRSRFALVDLSLTIVTCNTTKHQHITITSKHSTWRHSPVYPATHVHR